MNVLHCVWLFPVYVALDWHPFFSMHSLILNPGIGITFELMALQLLPPTFSKAHMDFPTGKHLDVLWTSPNQYVKNWILPSHKPVPLLVFPISVHEYNFEPENQVQQSFSLLPSPMSPVLHPVGHQVEWILFCTYRIWLTAHALVGTLGASCLEFYPGVLTGCSTVTLVLL